MLVAVVRLAWASHAAMQSVRNLSELGTLSAVVAEDMIQTKRKGWKCVVNLAGRRSARRGSVAETRGKAMRECEYEVKLNDAHVAWAHEVTSMTPHSSSLNA